MKKQISKRDKVMQVTLRLVADGGFHASPMSELARLSGVAVGTIYHHFASKEELIAALYEECRGNSAAAMIAHADPKLSMSRRFDAIWRGLFQHYFRNPLEFSFIEQYAHSPFTGSHAAGAAANGPVLEYFREGVKSGKFRKMAPEALAEFLHGTVATAVRLHLAAGKKTIQPKQLDHWVEMSWAAVKK